MLKIVVNTVEMMYTTHKDTPVVKCVDCFVVITIIHHFIEGVFIFVQNLIFALVDMGITPHIPIQNRTCPIKAYGFSFYIHTFIYKTDLFLF